ncbi:hypothetical protein D9Q98_004507 [Chlorella vulgaris]|uniref:Uncharacterized protein n=1 Tax=Chlorella vulgaris TaxID=3077 RepID=A0A9D4TPZ8_CHLVU|nr:hypothetical protein D9Q98_004507 [Chlorella vulgaris]
MAAAARCRSASLGAYLVACFLASAAAVASPGCPELREGCAATTLYRRAKSWHDYAQPIAVLQLGQAAASLHFVPGLREAAPHRFLAVGGANGSLLLLCPETGRLVAQHDTGTLSPATALGSYLLRPNTTVLVTGHASGELRLHSLVQPLAASRKQPDREEQLEVDGSSSVPWLDLTLMQVFTPTAMLCGSALVGGSSCHSQQQPQQQQQQQQGEEQVHMCPAIEQEPAAGICPPITQVHGVGRGGGVASTLVITDAAGRLAVLKHGGPSIKEAQVVRRVTLDQQPLAARLSSATAMLLGGSGSASQRTSMPAASKGQSAGKPGTAPAAPAQLVFKPCSGLNGSSLIAAVFDHQHTSRAFAVADDGRLLSLVLGGEKNAHSGCRVRAVSAPLLDGLLQPPGDGRQQQHQEHKAAVAAAWLPGYLLVTAGADLDWLLVFNVTAAPRSPPKLLLRSPLAALREQFGVQPPLHCQDDRSEQPEPCVTGQLPLAASRQGHVALMLNATVLAVYETALPYRSPAKAPLESMAWLKLFQPFAMAAVAGLVIFRARARRQDGGNDNGGGGGYGGAFSGGGGGNGGAGFSGDARLREFERLLQDPMAGLSRSRPQAGGGAASFLGGRLAPANHADDDSGSDEDDASSSLLARLRIKEADGGSNGSVPPPKRRSRLGRGGGSGGERGAGTSKDRAQAARLRAFSLAAADDRETQDLAAALAGRGVDAGSIAEAESLEVETQVQADVPMLQRLEEEEQADGFQVDAVQEEEAALQSVRGLAAAFGSDIDIRSSCDRDSDLSQLRHRLGLARIS